MRIPSVLFMSITAALYGSPIQAWEVKVDEAKQIEVTIDRDLRNSDTYLVFFDLDNHDEMFESWTSPGGWQAGLKPVTQKPLELSTFGPTVVTTLEPTCPAEHRCFLALVAVPKSVNPLLLDQWEASSLLPLSAAAARERLPSQQFFLPPTNTSASLSGYMPASGAALMNGKVAAEISGQTTTEKPDIFRLDGDQLLYANGQAQRFQIIDVKDPKQPRLADWVPLVGNPKELYSLNNNYILLQEDYTNNSSGTRITVLQKGTLTTVQELTLPGYFIESRRRNDFIYVVTQNYKEVTIMDDPVSSTCVDCYVDPSYIRIDVLRVREDGQLEKVKETELPGYNDITAIFEDYLVIAKPDPQKWPAYQIYIFDLTNNDDPLIALPVLEVPGRIPSEFHLDVQEQQLRVTYGPADPTDGSTLAIYDLKTATPTLLGKVDKIAPKEDLFATRFAGNCAYVVTYERKDPLWVIDISNPAAPVIRGELEVPGWSEKLFFHENRLFAVGINDQSEKPDQWVRQVALSLFEVGSSCDVTNLTQPKLLGRLIPLEHQANSSWSPALDDERALLLDWEQTLAALPIESWETGAGSYLQVLSLANDGLKDEGLVPSQISLQRSVSIAPNTLAALGDQALLTVQWGNQSAQVLAELELATNLTWLTYQGGNLWAAAMGTNGYYRLYHYTPANLETPDRHWSLPRAYNNVEVVGNLAVFYNYNPLAIQVVELDTGQLRPAQILETVKPEVPIDVIPPATDTPPAIGSDTSSVGTEETPLAITEPAPVMDAKIALPIWYNRTQPLVCNGWFHVPEQQPLSKEVQARFGTTSESQWLLRSWELKPEGAQETSPRSIPGQPLAFTPNCDLITQEFTENGATRVNLSALEPNNARLLQSCDVPCEGGYTSQVTTTDEGLVYASCVREIKYILPPSDTDPRATTTLVKLDLTQGCAEQGNWTVNKHWNLQEAAADVVMVSEGGWYGPWLMEGGLMLKDSAKMATMPPYYQPGCDIYRLIPDRDPILLKHLETFCPARESTALTPEQVWTAKGFAGIEWIKW